ncbi:unnamed protein product [Cunninghamella blakesleeana]
MATSMSNSMSMSPLQSPVLLCTPSSTVYTPSFPSNSPTSFVSSHFPSNISDVPQQRVQQQQQLQQLVTYNNNNLNMMKQRNNMITTPQQLQPQYSQHMPIQSLYRPPIQQSQQLQQLQQLQLQKLNNSQTGNNQALPDNIKAIFKRNNDRLEHLATGIATFVKYGNSCDELLEWLKDSRAYNSHNEKALMKCLSNISKHGPDFGTWSAIKIYDVVLQHSHLLSLDNADQVKVWYNELLKSQNVSVPVQRPAITMGTSNEGSASALVPFTANMTNGAVYVRHNLAGGNNPTFMAPQHHVNKQISEILQSINTRTPVPTSPTTPTIPTIPTTLNNSNHVNSNNINNNNNNNNSNNNNNNNNNQQNTTSYIPPNSSPQHNNTPTTKITTQKTLVTQTPNNKPTNKALTPQQHQRMDFSSFYKIKYMYRSKFILPPYRLRCDQHLTETQLYIGDAEYKQLTASLDSRLNPPNFYPIKYIFTSWKRGSPDTKCEWSEYINVLINDKEAKLERRKKVTTPDGASIYLGKDKPFDLLSYIQPGKNVLKIFQKKNIPDYSFSIISYICQSEDTIIKNLMDKEFSISDGEKRINKLLSIDSNDQNNDDDDEIHIVQQSVKLNLKCPISFTMIKNPVKGEDCRHPDCFDFKSYIAVNQDLATWKCPHCNSFLPPNKLHRDLYFDNILKTIPDYASEVIMTKECPEWKVVKSDFPDDDMDDSDDEIKPDKNDSNTNKKNKTIRQVISLISDDDDEEEEEEESNQSEKKRRRTQSNNSNNNNNNSNNNNSNSNNNSSINITTSTTTSMVTTAVPSAIQSPIQALSSRPPILSEPASEISSTTPSSPSPSSSNTIVNNSNELLAPDLLNIFEKIFNDPL